jgi:type II secretory pathway predicted ATPase ExeA
MDRKLQQLYGLKWNPFAPNIPESVLKMPQQMDMFFWQVEQMAFDGGFALLSGSPGTGKSTAMRYLRHRLSQVGGIKVASVERPQSTLRDFYQELGEIFGLTLGVSNRFKSFKQLRISWLNEIKNAHFRPFLLVDEAQSLPTIVLSEIRFLVSKEFDSQTLLSVILSGDDRLPKRLRAESELLPIDSRIKARYLIEKISLEDLDTLLDHVLREAGNSTFINQNVKKNLVVSANGNPRSMMILAQSLLNYAVSKEAAIIDEQLLFELNGTKSKPIKKNI